MNAEAKLVDQFEVEFRTEIVGGIHSIVLADAAVKFIELLYQNYNIGIKKSFQSLDLL